MRTLFHFVVVALGGGILLAGVLPNRLHRISRRSGSPVVPGWAGWFHEELDRHRAIKPLRGLGCSFNLVA